MLLLFTHYRLWTVLSDGRESQQYLVSVCPQGNSKSSCQTKISQLDGSCFIDEQVLWLQVPVDDSVRVAKAHTLQQLEKVVLRREEILDEATTETLSKVWSCEPTHFGSFINLNGKYDLAIMQHQACRLLPRDARKMLPLCRGTETFQSKQWQSLPLIHYSIQKQLAIDSSVILISTVYSTMRWAGEPGNSWETNALSNSTRMFPSCSVRDLTG